MKNDFLYRYVSFETFVGMIQNKALTFVLPSVWDDPKEDLPFKQFIDKIESGSEMAFLIAAHNKTYAQSWSALAESDAMWRIYAYNNRSLRIKVSLEKISRLNDIHVVEVKYSDEPFECENNCTETLLSSLAYKRTAFCHEKEIRLISTYKFEDKQDAELHIKAVRMKYMNPKDPERIEMLESMFPEMELEDKLERLGKLLNIRDWRKETKDISYAHISNFIDGVMVHPLAPEWYVNVVQEFCSRNKIPFEGQSQLYK